VPDLTTLSVEALEGLEADLAAERTAVRIRQNEVAAELAIRRALQSMPEAAREIVRLRLGGSVGVQGKTSTGAAK